MYKPWTMDNYLCSVSTVDIQRKLTHARSGVKKDLQETIAENGIFEANSETMRKEGKKVFLFVSLQREIRRIG